MKTIINILTGTMSLFTGMWITLKYALKKPSTVQYPQEKREVPKGVKGPIRFVYFEDKKSHDCIACTLCVTICPSFCIELKGGKTPEGKRRPYAFTIDYGTCSLCTLCVEVCPTNTLEHSDDIEWAGKSRENFLMDLIKDTEDIRLKTGAGATDVPTSLPTPPTSWVEAAEKAKAEAAQKAAEAAKAKEDPQA